MEEPRSEDAFDAELARVDDDELLSKTIEELGTEIVERLRRRYGDAWLDRNINRKRAEELVAIRAKSVTRDGH